MGRRVTEEKRKRILELTDTGYSIHTISKLENVSEATISRIRRDRKDVMRIAADKLAYYEWLKQYFPAKIVKSKTRKVHVGEKGHLRTPQRPDGIFW